MGWLAIADEWQLGARGWMRDALQDGDEDDTTAEAREACL